MREKTCCFTGHRQLSAAEREQLTPQLERAVRELIEEGVCFFGTGGAVGFDTLAAQTVLRLREIYPQVRLVLVLPCENQAEFWGLYDRAEYDRIKRLADKVVYTARRYTPDCMKARNCHLVDHSGVCIYYLKQYGGGTGYTVGYARRQGLRMICLGEA